MKHILNLNKNPLLTSEGLFANLISVISEVDYNNYYLANNFIHLYSLNGVFRFSLCRPILDMYSSCPYLYFQKINKEYIFNINKKSIINLVKESIDLGYYILLMIDKCFIKEFSYIKPHNHVIMVYGYDDCLGRVYFSDNDETGKYNQNLSCDNLSFENAYNNFFGNSNKPNYPFDEYIYLIKPRNDINYGLNIKQIQKSLQEYLLSEPYYITKMEYERKIMGIKAYENVIDFLKSDELIKKITNEVKKGFCNLWDHKKSLLCSIESLCSKSITDNNYIKNYKEVEQKTQKLIMQILKFQVSGNENIIKKVIEDIKYIHDNEYEILNSLLSDMDK